MVLYIHSLFIEYEYVICTGRSPGTAQVVFSCKCSLSIYTYRYSTSSVHPTAVEIFRT